MDVGTAFEAGYMSARSDLTPNEILIIGYTEGEYEPSYLTRVGADEHHKDSAGKSVENFGLSENLMIPAAIIKTGGKLFTSFEEAVNAIQQLWDAKQAAAEALKLDQYAVVLA
jgi:nucleoside 2-deoxyribosyltransferase